MGVDLHYSYYPKECDNPKILPFLEIDTTDYDDTWLNGKHVPFGFYDKVNEYSEWDEENGCWIFRDMVKLFKFASCEEVPVGISVYISNPHPFYYSKKGDYLLDDRIFIIWKR